MIERKTPPKSSRVQSTSQKAHSQLKRQFDNLEKRHQRLVERVRELEQIAIRVLAVQTATKMVTKIKDELGDTDDE